MRKYIYLQFIKCLVISKLKITNQTVIYLHFQLVPIFVMIT